MLEKKSTCCKKIKYSQNPELNVTQCTIYEATDAENKMDKLCNSLEMRLKHCGCSRDHKCSPEHHTAILNRILQLRDTSKECSAPSMDYYSTIYNMSLMSFAQLPPRLNDVCEKSCDDSELIRRIRRLLIWQRAQILNDPEKCRSVDSFKIRNCVRQYELMEKQNIDYYADYPYSDTPSAPSSCSQFTSQ